MRADKDVLRQQEAVRRSGKTNMLDYSTVQRIAYESDFHALVTFIEQASNEEYIEMAEKAAEWYAHNGDEEIPEVSQIPDTITVEVEI